MENQKGTEMNGISDEEWGQLAPFEAYGRAGDKKEDYPQISYEESRTQYTSQTHAAHAMIFAKSDKIIWDLYKVKAAVMMQMRFDGLIGFPGGLVDPGEDPVAGVNRELHEEINLDLDKFRLTDADHMVAHFHERKNLVLHFFSKEVTLDEFKEIETSALQAYEHGIEAMESIRLPLLTMGDNFRGFPAFLTNNFAGTRGNNSCKASLSWTYKRTMGSIRPPLFTMGDNFRGLPAFLTNNFAGNAREQLLRGLSKLAILTDEEIHTAYKAAQDFNANR